ncbi:nucleotidyltransferase domain-containing protein [Paenibacillus taihuensis]|nr:nucleotidyltransferase domain-containing protein [Paenibacillus taihuensis]
MRASRDSRRSRLAIEGSDSILLHIEDFIHEFLHEDLLSRTNVETVILCGSYATGKATMLSDIDLCYIGSFASFQRESIAYQGREFQLMLAPWSWYEHVVNEYERKGNLATITVMLATGTCLIGDSDQWRGLKQLADQLYYEGPQPPSTEELRKIRVQLTDIWEDYCDKIDTQERLWLSIAILQNCMEAIFRIRGWWSVKPKYQLEEIYARDSRMAELLEQCLSSIGTQNELETICRYVLEPIGGWMKESWKA